MNESVINMLPSLYLETDSQGKITQVNKRLCEALGYDDKELVGNDIESIFTLPTRIFYQTHLFPLLKMAKKADEIYLALQAKNKTELPVLCNTQMVEDNNTAILSFVGIVVHNRKKFEEELIAARKTAESALSENTALLDVKATLQEYVEQLDEKMFIERNYNEELKQFNQVLTHDLYEPLRKMLLYTSYALKNSENDRPDLQKVREFGENMRSILAGLQQYVWLTDNEMKFSSIDLNKVIEDVISVLRKENPWVKIQLEKEDIPNLWADREQMKLLIYHVLSNCIRFRKPGDEVSIKISATSLVLNKIRSMVGKYKYEDFLRLVIVDDGMGFDAEYNDQAFALFKRLHQVSGRGVGLKLCKKIIDNHLGEISIKGEKGKGAMVTILLPLRTDDLEIATENKFQQAEINDQ